jgi:hypothetical protein
VDARIATVKLMSGFLSEPIAAVAMLSSLLTCGG